MKYIVCSVRDRAAVIFGQPFFSAARGAAIRGFSDAINKQDGNSQLYAHPEDFDLFYLGTFDDQTGLFECVTPEQIAVGKDLRV